VIDYLPAMAACLADADRTGRHAELHERAVDLLIVLATRAIDPGAALLTAMHELATQGGLVPSNGEWVH
jgi:hypothetical protein